MVVITETARLSRTALAAKADFIVERMTDNDDFPNPQPSLASVTAAAVVLRQAVTGSLDGGKTATAIRKVRHKELHLMLNKLAGHVSSVAGEDELLIRSCGFGVRRTPTPQGEPGKPASVRAAATEHLGRVDLAWTPVPEAVTYHIQHTQGDPLGEDGWELIAVSTRAAVQVKGLPSAKLSHFRVAGIGTAGMGPWSQVSSCLVK
jgi:hypothetical protein